jgi:protein-S-isoprenylcysteine O-methyltransferase Ste14
MLLSYLKIAAYCAYLAAWVVFAIAAIAGALPRLRRLGIITPAAPTPTIQAPVVIGTLLQALAAFVVTLSMPSGPLHPAPSELAGALVLAPFGAALFAWAVRSAPDPEKGDKADPLVTGGAYAWLRHPMYLAFLALLVATGLLVSGGGRLILAALLYLGGSELRIASEEAELAGRFPAEHARYKRQTRWRYLPGLR